MRLVRLGIAHVNSTVGAVWDNVARLQHWAQEAHHQSMHLLAFPEQAVGGYAPEDLVQWQSFVEAQKQALMQFVQATQGLSPVFVLGVLVAVRGQIYNCAAVVHKGRLHGLCPKEKLPFYNVFYEGRTLSRGVPFHQEWLQWDEQAVPFGDFLFQADFGTFATEVCEDIWSPDGPMRRRCLLGAELVVNVSASPFRIGVHETRKEMICTRSNDSHATVLYSNLVGANDGLVFDGGGYLIQNGRLLFQGTRFAEGLDVGHVDLDRTLRLRAEDTTWRLDSEIFFQQHDPVQPILLHEPTFPCLPPEKHYPFPAHRSFFLPAPSEKEVAPRTQFCEDVLQALVLGIGDYFEKTKAFSCIGVALSGGRDSLLCLLLTHRYLQKKFAHLDESQRNEKIRSHLRVFYMPSVYSSPHTRHAAEKTAAELGLSLVILPIDEAVQTETAAAQRMLQPGEQVSAITLQNIQARVRGQRMWNWANSTAGLFLQTSNMSEKSVGYTTIGGDMMGCISPIANLPKTVVLYLLAYLQETENLDCIRTTLQHPASAELAAQQESEQDLMPFAVLDSCLMLFVGEKLHPTEAKSILVSMFPEHAAEKMHAWVDKFVKLFTQSIFKWVQMPLALHVGHLDLDRERALQIPVVSSAQWIYKPSSL